jgi:molybdenum cofactor cytidylyltransferase
VLVLPVDFPLIRTETIKQLITEFRKGEATVIRPAHDGAAGHPTLFARALYGELSRTDLPEGARSVIAAQQQHVLDVAVNDPGVNTDIDTPDDYRRHVPHRDDAE